jgi:hypothetical protein
VHLCLLLHLILKATQWCNRGRCYSQFLLFTFKIGGSRQCCNYPPSPLCVHRGKVQIQASLPLRHMTEPQNNLKSSLPISIVPIFKGKKVGRVKVEGWKHGKNKKRGISKIGQWLAEKRWRKWKIRRLQSYKKLVVRLSSILWGRYVVKLHSNSIVVFVFPLVLLRKSLSDWLPFRSLHLFFGPLLLSFHSSNKC